MFSVEVYKGKACCSRVSLGSSLSFLFGIGNWHGFGLICLCYLAGSRKDIGSVEFMHLRLSVFCLHVAGFRHQAFRGCRGYQHIYTCI